MKWEETVASKCRYGDVAEAIFGNCEIIWECSEADYQGSANVLAKTPDGKFIHYEWTYGSCSGCDEWEDRELSYEQIEAEMRQHMAVLKDEETLLRYLKLEDDPKIPTAQSPTAGSIPGMLRYLAGGIASEFDSMSKAALEYLNRLESTPNEHRQD